jgi:hypothetical protein
VDRREVSPLRSARADAAVLETSNGLAVKSYLHCFAFLRSSIVCKHHDAQPQAEVPHFFEQAFMQALTSQLTASADGAKATESP